MEPNRLYYPDKQKPVPGGIVSRLTDGDGFEYDMGQMNWLIFSEANGSSEENLKDLIETYRMQLSEGPDMPEVKLSERLEKLLAEDPTLKWTWQQKQYLKDLEGSSVFGENVTEEDLRESMRKIQEHPELCEDIKSEGEEITVTNRGRGGTTETRVEGKKDGRWCSVS